MPEPMLLLALLLAVAAAVVAFKVRSPVTRAVLITGAVLGIGAWLPLLALVGADRVLGTEYGDNALGLGLLGFAASSLGGIVAAVGLMLSARERLLARRRRSA